MFVQFERFYNEWKKTKQICTYIITIIITWLIIDQWITRNQFNLFIKRSNREREEGDNGESTYTQHSNEEEKVKAHKKQNIVTEYF